MHVGFESKGAHLTNQIAEAEVLRKVARNTRVFTNNPITFSFQFVAGGNRRAYENTVLHV